MKVYKRLIFPVLKLIDPEDVHDRTLNALSLAQNWTPWVLNYLKGYAPLEPIDLFGLTFPNVLGVAAGFDKDARVAKGLALLGFGHVEVGTFTPRPQMGNPRPRIFRLPMDGALINRMGFPNEGIQAAVPRLKALTSSKRNFILGVSLGKQKETPLAEAIIDYVTMMKAIYSYADYLAINISSPNTPGLRKLQGGEYFGNILKEMQEESNRLATEYNIRERPLLIKIAPDLTWEELDEILNTALEHKVDGIIATNTTVNRNGLMDAKQKESGGLSGRPLRQRSNEIIAYIHRHTNGQLPIIGVGGVQMVKDVREKLAAGASLVQLYTGIIYGGPSMVGNILRQLKVDD